LFVIQSYLSYFGTYKTVKYILEMKFKFSVLWMILLGLFAQENFAQIATIHEEYLSMNTYMFSDPSPIPQFGRLYPYSRFDGYTNKGEKMEWKMVVLENDYIKVFVCPDIGGKVYGAIEKSTGKEFLYFNNSVKFRDVAMRGAWTSGGLEYNFGDIGHIPTCATPVDYKIQENEDGSVSCIVGALDLPSRTNWNVEIRLEKDKAYFETKATWFNNTSLPVTYYHWMNAAAKADGNLEFLYPGNKKVGHGGEVGDWPKENERELNYYEKNNFGVYKSYHVINAYSDYFGGYYHDDDFGFGHYGSYDDKPGRKIWIWGLSDQGMIWEDLLTDTDGQYIEYQAGKLFNQAANNSTFTPYKHREFTPHDTDEMKEYWFPLLETKGMVAASKNAVLNVEREGDIVTLFLSPLGNLNETLKVISEDQLMLEEKINNAPLELFTTSFVLKKDKHFEVILGDHKLKYSSDLAKEQNIDRPTDPNMNFDWNSGYGIYTQALEFEKQRRYQDAHKLYHKSYELEPGFAPTLNRLALSYYRIMRYSEGVKYAKLSLGIDTYDPLANYVFGLNQMALGNLSDAKSGFSIASQNTSYRSASYTELAKIFLKEKDLIHCESYLKKALAFNKFNRSALEMLALTYRKKNLDDKAVLILNELTKYDGNSHFINAEKLFLNLENEGALTSQITNELIGESYLELALKYHNYGFNSEALKILELGPQNVMLLLWKSYLKGDKGEVDFLNSLKLSPDLVFPHRVESMKMLHNFIELNSNWKLKYYLSLIYWNKGLLEEAKQLILDCEEVPKSVSFYLARAKMFIEDTTIVDRSYKLALKLDTDDWRVNMEIIQRDLIKNKYKAAINRSKIFVQSHPEKAKFGMLYAKALMGEKSYEKCIAFLSEYKVLPYEGATDGRKIYHEACVKAALLNLKKGNYKKAIEFATKAKLWPTNLGVGKHYDVDERLDDFIIAYSWDKLNESSKAIDTYKKIGNHITPDYLNEGSVLLLQLQALSKINLNRKVNKVLENAVIKNSKNQYLSWVQAKYNGTENVREIKESILNTDLTIQVYDTKFVDSQFELLLELLRIIE
jgi:tetratricopeptide (TPR) repeat protein